jgi:hypothetical protein
MVQTITPVVHGGRRSRWGASIALHTLGATGSAAAFGAILAAGGAVLGAPWGKPGTLFVGGLALLYAAREVFDLPIPIPDRRRQVPEWWRSAFSPGTAAFLYGLGLGMGFLTHVRFGTLVVVSGVALGSGDPVAGALLMAPFGLARGISIAVVWAGVSTRRVQGVVDRLEALAGRPVATVANVAVLLLVGAFALLLPSGYEAGPAFPAATWALAFVFGWASLAKLARIRSWRETLGGYALPRALHTIALPAVPLGEAGVPILAISGRIREAAALALVLLVVFCAAVIRARRIRGHRLPCGCFGRGKVRDYRLLLLRNAVLGLLSVAVVVREAHGRLLDGTRAPRASEAIPAFLIVVALALGITAVAHLRRLHERALGARADRG